MQWEISGSGKERRRLATVGPPADGTKQQLPFVADKGNDLTGDEPEEQDTGQRDNGRLQFWEKTEQAVDVCGVCGRILVWGGIVDDQGFAVPGRVADFDGERGKGVIVQEWWNRRGNRYQGHHDEDDPWGKIESAVFVAVHNDVD